MTAEEENKDTTDNKTNPFGGTVHEEFKEAEELQTIAANLINIYQDGIAVEMAIEKYQFIVDEYQEQPHLMDPYLEPMLAQLLGIARDTKTPEPVMHLAYKLLYLITKTRNFKVVVRLMPHEVADLEPVLAMLAKQSPTDFQTWETRYMLLLWLSLVCMIPFDMERLDSNITTESGEKRKPIMERIIDAGQRYIGVSDKSRDAAAYMLSRFMTRPDVKKQKLPEFMDWTMQQLANSETQTMTGMTGASGIMNTLALLFKHGKREDLVDYAPTVLEQICKMNLKQSSNTLLRKLNTKLVQRLGLIFLKAKVAAWRYQRGSRSLTENLSLQEAKSGIEQKPAPMEVDDEDYDIPDQIEDIIEFLLNDLKDKDTVVRWSAAKGLGRVTGRLPKELADEVVGSIMEMFSLISETDASWHGACLSLAELGRRGLLVPQRLPDVVPVIIRALNYDEKRGNFSIGSHVRDAACYVSWAFARAYDPKELVSHVNNIANALLIVSVFDREVNVRRAAAAAFQEHVGRQGQFPHGIDILTTVDYFAVGNRNSCYHELSVYVAQFPEYTRSMIDHLVQVKTSHWDSGMRELTSEALHNLTEKSSEYMAKSVLPQLVKMCLSPDINQRHGAILSTAQVTHALSRLAGSEQKTIKDVIEASTIEDMREITPKLQKAQLFRGVGGELMRKAVCCLIEKLSLSKLQYHEQPIVSIWQELMDDCLQHVEQDIQCAAISALPAFFTEYYQTSDGTINQQCREAVIEKYLQKLQDNVESVRMGYALAIGAFPKFFISGKLKLILGSLIRACMLTDKHQKFAEARRDAIKALTSICVTIGVEKGGSPQEVLCSDNINEVYDSLFMAMKDYTLDSRGDVGAWVREAAMTGLYDITDMILKQEPTLYNNDITNVLFCNLIQQSSEKIDRTRGHAGEIFSKLLYHEPEIPKIPHKEFLVELFPKSYCGTFDWRINCMNWSAPSDTFPKFTELLSQPTYTYHTLLGLTVSVGGLTESLVKHSATSLMKYLSKISEDSEKINLFNQTLLKVFKDHQKVDRVTLPMLKMLNQLLTTNYCFDQYSKEENHEIPVTLHSLCKEEITRCGEVQKLLASVDVFCGLLQFPGDVRKKTLFQLAVFLCHKFPILRKTTASKLYESIVTYDGLVEDENMDEVLTLLSETQWDEPIDSIRPIRNKICDLLGISKPVAVKKG